MTGRKIKVRLRSFINRLIEFKVLMKEYASNKKSYDTRETTLERDILLTAHSIEKGMGLRNSEAGHSVDGIKRLIWDLNQFLILGYDVENSFAFKEGVAALREYIKYQKSFRVESKTIQEFATEYAKILGKLDPKICEEIASFKCGVKLFDSTNVEQRDWNDFKDFVYSRHSVRMYKKELIPDEIVREAVEIANHCPSACNRQPNKVYFSNKTEVSSQIDKLISGNRGFEGEIQNYVIVTTDRCLFAGEEQFQWYTGGGIYLANLTLALHSLGLASCIMQWRAFYKTEKDLKELLGASDHEAIIAIVGIGRYDKDCKVIEAQRMSSDYNLTIL